MPKVVGSNPSGGSELTLRSDLLLIVLLTARDRSLWQVIACLLCYPGNTLCSQRLEPLKKDWVVAIKPSPPHPLFFVSLPKQNNKFWHFGIALLVHYM
jgi:hypothetical protein